MENSIYSIRDTEAGNIIGHYNSFAEAEAEVINFEENDKFDEIYTEDFYEIVPFEPRKSSLDMDLMVKSLQKQFSGHGHYKVFVTVDGMELQKTTSDMTAIDAAFDEFYDDEDNSGDERIRIYDSRREAQESLVKAVLWAHGLDI